MQAIEFETRIDPDGHVHVPEQFQHAYGKFARMIVLLPERSLPLRKTRQAGSAKGILKIVSEDEEHLSDFEDYMS